MCWTIWTKVFYLVGYVSLFVLKYTIVTQSHGLSHVRDSSEYFEHNQQGRRFQRPIFAGYRQDTIRVLGCWEAIPPHKA